MAQDLAKEIALDRAAELIRGTKQLPPWLTAAIRADEQAWKHKLKADLNFQARNRTHT